MSAGSCAAASCAEPGAPAGAAPRRRQVRGPFLTLRTVYFRLVVTTALWGGTFPAGKIAVRELPPLAAGTLRFALATAALALLLARDRRRPRFTARQIGLLALLGATGVFGYNVGFLVGLTLAPSADGALLIPPNNPLATALLAALLLGEPITRRVAAGLAVAFVVVVLVVAAGAQPAVGGAAGLARLAGDALFLGAVFGWALYTVVGRLVLAELTPLEATTYSSAFGTLGLAGASLVEGRWDEVAGASAAAWTALAYLALLGTVVGFVWWYQAVVRIGAARAAAFINLVPVFGLSASALLLGERLVPWQLAGAALVMTGVILTTTARRGPPDRRSAGATRAGRHAGPQTT